MNVVQAYPPNYEAIIAVFPVAATPGVIFTYGQNVYAPAGGRISSAVHAHEQVHADRQGDDPARWWERYLVDAIFRFEEELPAHQAEYAWFRRYRPKKAPGMLKLIAERLSGPLYGNVVSLPEAMRLIKEQGAA